MNIVVKFGERISIKYLFLISRLEYFVVFELFSNGRIEIQFIWVVLGTWFLVRVFNEGFWEASLPQSVNYTKSIRADLGIGGG